MRSMIGVPGKAVPYRWSVIIFYDDMKVVTDRRVGHFDPRGLAPSYLSYSLSPPGHHCNIHLLCDTEVIMEVMTHLGTTPSYLSNSLLPPGHHCKYPHK